MKACTCFTSSFFTMHKSNQVKPHIRFGRWGRWGCVIPQITKVSPWWSAGRSAQIIFDTSFYRACSCCQQFRHRFSDCVKKLQKFNQDLLQLCSLRPMQIVLSSFISDPVSQTWMYLMFILQPSWSSSLHNDLSKQRWRQSCNYPMNLCAAFSFEPARKIAVNHDFLAS